MSAYVVATVRRVHDRKALEAYWAHVGPTFEGTGVNPLAVYTPFKQIEGEGPIQAMVVIEFPDMDRPPDGTTARAIRPRKNIAKAQRISI